MKATEFPAARFAAWRSEIGQHAQARVAATVQANPQQPILPERAAINLCNASCGRRRDRPAFYIHPAARRSSDGMEGV